MTTVNTGDPVLILVGAIALGLTIAMFLTKNLMLGYPCAIFWASLSGLFYAKSAVTWDAEYILFFACFGMTVFCVLVMFALRRRDISGPDDVREKYIDEGSERKTGIQLDPFSKVGEDKKDSLDDEFSLGDPAGNNKMNKRRQALHDRAEKRRTGGVQRKQGWGSFS